VFIISNIVYLEEYKRLKSDQLVNDNEDSFSKAIERLTKQNGICYDKLLLGTPTEKAKERKLLNEKMARTKRELESDE
jgi:hypothetical protein